MGAAAERLNQICKESTSAAFCFLFFKINKTGKAIKKVPAMRPVYYELLRHKAASL